MKGNLSAPLDMANVRATDDLAIGDIVVTAGGQGKQLESQFPRNIVIGTHHRGQTRPGEHRQHGPHPAAANLESLESVLVVTDYVPPQLPGATRLRRPKPPTSRRPSPANRPPTPTQRRRTPKPRSARSAVEGRPARIADVGPYGTSTSVLPRVEGERRTRPHPTTLKYPDSPRSARRARLPARPRWGTMGSSIPGPCGYG